MVTYRTPKGNPTATARKKKATLSEGRFPIFDKQSAESALRLRGKTKSKEERRKVINGAAKYQPAMAKKAREQDKKNKLI